MIGAGTAPAAMAAPGTGAATPFIAPGTQLVKKYTFLPKPVKRRLLHISGTDRKIGTGMHFPVRKDATVADAGKTSGAHAGCDLVTHTIRGELRRAYRLKFDTAVFLPVRDLAHQGMVVCCVK